MTAAAVSEKVFVSGPASAGPAEIPVKFSAIEDSEILRFLAAQSTVIVGSGAASWVAAAQAAANRAVSIFGYRVELAPRRTLDLSDAAALRISGIANAACERAIVATVAPRPLRATVSVAAMKALKAAHAAAASLAAAARRSLFRNYAFYLRGGALASGLRRATVVFHDAASAVSEALRTISVAIQNGLIEGGYYYKEQVFSDDLLYTIAKELALAYQGERLTIKAIQEKLKIASYRQARKIWSAVNQISAAQAALA